MKVIAKPRISFLEFEEARIGSLGSVELVSRGGDDALGEVQRELRAGRVLDGGPVPGVQVAHRHVRQQVPFWLRLNRPQFAL